MFNFITNFSVLLEYSITLCSYPTIPKPVFSFYHLLQFIIKWLKILFPICYVPSASGDIIIHSLSNKCLKCFLHFLNWLVWGVQSIIPVNIKEFFKFYIITFTPLKFTFWSDLFQLHVALKHCSTQWSLLPKKLRWVMYDMKLSLVFRQNLDSQNLSRSQL